MKYLLIFTFLCLAPSAFAESYQCKFDFKMNMPIVEEDPEVQEFVEQDLEDLQVAPPRIFGDLKVTFNPSGISNWSFEGDLGSGKSTIDGQEVTFEPKLDFAQLAKEQAMPEMLDFMKNWGMPNLRPSVFEAKSQLSKNLKEIEKYGLSEAGSDYPVFNLFIFKGDQGRVIESWLYLGNYPIKSECTTFSNP